MFLLTAGFWGDFSSLLLLNVNFQLINCNSPWRPADLKGQGPIWSLGCVSFLQRINTTHLPKLCSITLHMLLVDLQPLLFSSFPDRVIASSNLILITTFQTHQHQQFSGRPHGAWGCLGLLQKQLNNWKSVQFSVALYMALIHSWNDLGKKHLWCL